MILKGTKSQGAAMITGNCTVPAPKSSGQVEYDWLTGDTQVSDTYNVEFEITWSGGGIETVPNAGYAQIVIQDDLENA